MFQLYPHLTKNTYTKFHTNFYLNVKNYIVCFKPTEKNKGKFLPDLRLGKDYLSLNAMKVMTEEKIKDIIIKIFKAPVYAFIQGYFSLRKSLFNWYSVDFVHNQAGIVFDSLT